MLQKFFEPIARLFTPPIRANVLHSQWAESRREMGESILNVQLLARWLEKQKEPFSEVLRQDMELAELMLRRHAQAWRLQLILAMEAEAEMLAAGIPFDRGEGKDQ